MVRINYNSLLTPRRGVIIGSRLAWKASVLETGLGVRQVMRLDARSDDLASPPYIKTQSMYYCYLLLLSNGDIYKGFTEDLKRRISEHQAGKVASTKNYLPVILIGYEAYACKSDAKRREEFLKTTEGRRLLKQQYRDILKKYEREIVK